VPPSGRSATMTSDFMLSSSPRGVGRCSRCATGTRCLDPGAEPLPQKGRTRHAASARTPAGMSCATVCSTRAAIPGSSASGGPGTRTPTSALACPSRWLSLTSTHAMAGSASPNMKPGTGPCRREGGARLAVRQGHRAAAHHHGDGSACGRVQQDLSSDPKRDCRRG
jgi:hypothetical protein